MSNDWVRDIHYMQTKFGTRDAVEKMDKDISFLLYDDASWPFDLTLDTAEKIKKNLINEDIDVFFDDRIVNIEKKRDGYLIYTEKGLSQEYDMIFSFLGMIPNISFIIGSGIDTDRGILVDDNLKTN